MLANQRNTAQPTMKRKAPSVIAFLFPCTQVRSCASVGWCGIFDGTAFSTISPAIQSPTARGPATSAIRRSSMFMSFPPFDRSGNDGLDLAPGVEDDAERRECQHGEDTRGDDDASPQPHQRAAAAGAGCAGT